LHDEARTWFKPDALDDPQKRHGRTMIDYTKHKLAAILHADVVGYSALMSAAEDETHADLVSSMETAESAVDAHGGRLSGKAGDSFVAHFDSILDALAAARDFQARIAEANAGKSAEQQLKFRIGLNLGEIIEDGADIFGSGVNIAARIQTLAPAGGIAVSGSVHGIVKNRVNLQFTNLGEHEVKNIPDPVRVFAVAQEAVMPVAKPQRWIVMSVVFLALLAFAVALWSMGTGTALWTPGENASGGQLAQSDARPTVAVLPFEVFPDTKDQAVFGDGVTEDVIAELGRFSGILVLSWSAVSSFRGQAVSMERLKNELGVRYVVSGSVRQSASTIRIAVQLSDAARGVLLWSSRYEEPFADLFSVQDRISREVVRTLAVKVTSFEQQRSLAKPTDSLNAYEKVLRGRQLLSDPEFSDNLDARELFQEAIDLDPEYADAHVGIGLTHIADLYWGWVEDPRDALDASERQALKALNLNPDHAGARALWSETLWLQGDLSRAEEEISRALALNPNNSHSHMINGRLLLFRGKIMEAIWALELAIRIDPSIRAIVPLATAYYLLGQYDQAVNLLDSQLGEFPDDPVPHAIRAAALAQLGRNEDAEAAAENVRKIYPFFNSAVAASNFNAPDAAERLEDGFRKAGLD
jgi:adenylate cyclase